MSNTYVCLIELFRKVETVTYDLLAYYMSLDKPHFSRVRVQNKPLCLIDIVILSSITAICKPECLNAGTCSSPGHCTCNSDWTGNKCQTRKTFLFVCLFVCFVLCSFVRLFVCLFWCIFSASLQDVAGT